MIGASGRALGLASWMGSEQPPQWAEGPCSLGGNQMGGEVGRKLVRDDVQECDGE
jgi:hypothetical protein